FARLGYQGTTIDRIARDAGVTKGAVYYHFRDKQQLLFEAVKDHVGEFERQVLAEVTPELDAMAALRHVVDVCFFHATVSSHRRFIITLMVEALDTNPALSVEFRNILRRMRVFLADVVRRGQQRGVLRGDVSAEAAAAVVAGAIMGAEIQHYQDPERAVLLEELAYGDLALALHLLAPRLFTIPLVVAGTEEQRARWLPRFTGLEFSVATAAFIEPRWDFDPTALATRATRRGGDWIITGEKCLVPLARDPHAILVYAGAPDVLAAFLVERKSPGLTVGEREKNMGIKALDTFPLRLEDVRVPASSRLGGEGTDVRPLVDASRLASAALAVGVSRAAFDHARDYAKDRRAFGQAIAQKQAIAFMLADMAIEIDAMRL